MKSILKLLAEAHEGLVILDGLSDQQFTRLETKYEFTFPPDVRTFLSFGVPHFVKLPNRVPVELPAFYQTANDKWHNWHLLAKDDVTIGSEFDTVTKQISWHATPEDEEVPADCKLIPIYSHRMIPSNPCQAGNPVFSMHGCYDNIIYGHNFLDYLERDHKIKIPGNLLKEHPTTNLEDIPFWPKYLH